MRLLYRGSFVVCLSPRKDEVLAPCTHLGRPVGWRHLSIAASGGNPMSLRSRFFALTYDRQIARVEKAGFAAGSVKDRLMV